MPDHVGQGLAGRSDAQSDTVPSREGTTTGGLPAPRTGGRAEARRARQGKAPVPDVGSGRAANRAGRKPKRNAKKIAAWSAAGALVLVAAAGGAIYLKLNGNIQSFDEDAISKDRPPEAQADADGNKPVNMLLIGSDSRAGNNGDLGGGEEGVAHSDTAILLHVYADHKHAVGVSLPRDTLVTIPPCKLPDGKWTKELTKQRINVAFTIGQTEAGNPACTQNTVEKLTGIRIDHTIVVDFQGFSAMTKAVGGVDICLPAAIYEQDLNQKLPTRGKEVLKKGPQKVEGQQALDYVRLRHGIGDGSDIGRMKRQQAFLSSLITSVKKQGLNPTTLLPLADAATKSMTVDPGLNSVDKLMALGLSLKNIDLHDLKFVTAPWRFNGPYVDLVKPDVDKLWETVKADRTIDGQNATGQQADAPASPTTPPPSPVASQPATLTVDKTNQNIRVSVYNGTTTTGLAGKAGELLKSAKFTVTKMGTAASTKYATTMVEYGEGQKANAEKVAAAFPGATVEAGSSPGITVIVGKDFAATNGAAQTTSATPATAPSDAAASAAATPLPNSVTADARSADDDLCSNTTYGSGG